MRLFFLTLTLLIFANIHHPFLWGPDEPREAEIAREMWRDGKYVSPRFCQIPFVEKPPLYYQLTAGAFALAGAPVPGAARTVSAALGVVMLLALFLIARYSGGQATAVTAAALCATMPQFYRATHWILLDIGVGASLTAALAVYGYWVLNPGKKESNGMLILFYLAAAAAFLTKGVVALVYLGIVIAGFMVYKRRRLPFRLNWTVLFFLLPVGVWIWLFYLEGGVYYLHEHFVNNIVGRLLHREFRLEGSPITVSDVGNASSCFFYFERLPNMFGAALVLIPPAVWTAVRALRSSRSSSAAAEHAAKKRTPVEWIGKYWNRLTRPAPGAMKNRDFTVYLLLWSFLPLFVFSIPAIKEVTYLLPSYAGTALLLAHYIAGKMPGNEYAGKEIFRFYALPVLLFILATQGLSPFTLTGAAVFCVLIWIGIAYFLYRSCRTGKIRCAVLLILAALSGGVALGNTPALMLRTRLNRKCYIDLAQELWRHAGNRRLFIFGGDESIRGSVPFYGDRNVTVIPDAATLRKTLEHPENSAILFVERVYRRLTEKDGFPELTRNYRLEKPECRAKAGRFILLLSNETPESAPR